MAFCCVQKSVVIIPAFMSGTVSSMK